MVDYSRSYDNPDYVAEMLQAAENAKQAAANAHIWAQDAGAPHGGGSFGGVWSDAARVKNGTMLMSDYVAKYGVVVYDASLGKLTSNLEITFGDTNKNGDAGMWVTSSILTFKSNNNGDLVLGEVGVQAKFVKFNREQAQENAAGVPVFLQSVDARSVKVKSIAAAWYGYAQYRETYSLPTAVPFIRRTLTVTRNLSFMVVNGEFSKREVKERVAQALNIARVAVWHQLDQILVCRLTRQVRIFRDFFSGLCSFKILKRPLLARTIILGRRYLTLSLRGCRYLFNLNGKK